MKSFQLPVRRLSAVLIASSALSLTLTGCLESPNTFTPGSITTSADSTSTDHNHSGTTDTTHDHTSGTDTTTGGTGATGDTTQNPAAEDFVRNLWIAPVKISDLSSGALDSIIGSPEMLVDSYGNQFASLTLSSNLDTTSQTYSSNISSVYIKPANATQWQLANPFANNSAIIDLQIKTDRTSGKTFALWKDASNSVFISNFDTTANAWTAAEQITNPSDRNVLLISSHGMPVIVGINGPAGSLTFTVKSKMHDGTWAADLTLSRSMPTTVPYFGRMAFALDSNDNPVLLWSEQTVSGWELWQANLNDTNVWAETQALSVATANTAGIDLSQIMSLGLVTSTTDQSLEAIVVLHSGAVFSIPRMTMDNGASYMWHTPSTLIDGTLAAQASLKPQLYVNGSNAMLLWGEHMMGAMSSSTTDGTSTAQNTTTHVHKTSARVMVMADTNMLKGRSFSITNNWGVTETIASASSGKLIKYVTPVLSDSGIKTVSWIEADATANQLFASHNVSNIWKTKELVSEINVQAMQMQLPMVGVNANGVVQAMWANQMTATTGVKSFGLWTSNSTGQVHVVQNTGSTDVTDTTGNGDGTGTTDPTDGHDHGTDTGNTTPVASATWGVPQTIWTGNIASGSSRQFRGPSVDVDATGHALIYMEKTPDFDAATNTFSSGEYLFYRHIEGSIWSQTMPQAPVEAPNAKLIRYSAIKSTGEIYALWSDNLNLYFSRYLPTVNQWLPAEALNINATKPNLLVNETGMATLVWTSLDSINNTLLVNAKHFMPATGWMEARNTSVELSAIVLEPIMNEAGVITVPWLTRAASHTGEATVHADLWTADFDPTTGWSTHTQGVHVPEFAGYTSKVYNLTPDMRVATFYNFFNKTLSASVYMTGMGWGEMINIDQNNGSGSLVVSKPIVAANDQGKIMLVWLQTNVDSTTGVTQYHYMSSEYSMANGWTSPVMIAHSDGNDSELDLVLDSSGHAIATWITTGPMMSMVHVSHYMPGMGWSATPEMLASYDMMSLEKASHPSVDINLSGQAVITWDHVMLMDTMESHHIQAVTNF